MLMLENKVFVRQKIFTFGGLRFVFRRMKYYPVMRGLFRFHKQVINHEIRIPYQTTKIQWKVREFFVRGSVEHQPPIGQLANDLNDLGGQKSSSKSKVSNTNIALDIQNPPNIWWEGVWSPQKPSQEMFRGSNTFSKGVWKYRVC